MKCVQRDRHILYVFRDANSKLRREIIKNCDNCVIQTLSEIIHNCMNKNIPIEGTNLEKLKKYKRNLRSLHSYIKNNKSIRSRRRKFSSQVGGQIGGFWPLLLNAVLSSALSYGGDKLLEYGGEKLKQIFNK